MVNNMVKLTDEEKKKKDEAGKLGIPSAAGVVADTANNAVRGIDSFVADKMNALASPQSHMETTPRRLGPEINTNGFEAGNKGIGGGVLNRAGNALSSVANSASDMVMNSLAAKGTASNQSPAEPPLGVKFPLNLNIPAISSPATDRRRNSQGSRDYQEGRRLAGRDNPVGADVTGDTLAGAINQQTGIDRAPSASLSHTLGRAGKAMLPAVVATGAAVDDLIGLPKRAFQRVGDDISRGFSGAPPNTERFVAFPAGEAVASGNIARRLGQPAVSQPGSALAATVDNTLAGTTSANTISQPPSTSPPTQYNLVGKPTRGPLTGDAATDIAEARAFLAADNEWRKSQGGMTSSEFNRTLAFPGKEGDVVEPQPLPETMEDRPKGFTREVINGNQVSRINLGGQGGRQMVDFGSPNLSGDPVKDKVSIDAFTAKVNAWRVLNGLTPLDQAQANHANAQATNIPVAEQRLGRTAGIDAEVKGVELAQAKKNQALLDQLDNPDLPDADRTRIMQRLGMKREDEYDTIKEFNELGAQTGERLYSKKTGLDGPGGGRQLATPTAATIARMKKNKGNPAYEAEYKKLFGPLPY